MTCRGIRGAITVEENTAAAILEATRTLLTSMREVNAFAIEELASVIFTATPDLTAVYPAAAAREMGWTQTPLLCMQEMAAAGSLPRCIRVLLHWNTNRLPGEVQHVYLRGARVLRPDLMETNP
ncbi:MAG: chorismate mutase [Anaerolineae bacterium]